MVRIRTSEDFVALKVNPCYKIRNVGNWHYYTDKLNPIYTKPIGFITLGDTELQLKHKEILEILDLYFKVDLDSVKMIKDKNIDTGNVNNFEEFFLIKVHKWINKKYVELEKWNQEKNI